MKLSRRQLGLCGLALLTRGATASPATQASGATSPALVWAPLQAQAGGGLQRMTLGWALLRAAPAGSLDTIQVQDAKGQVLPSAWAGAPAQAQSRRTLPLPLWAWPDEAPVGPAEGARSLAVELDAQGRVRRILSSTSPQGPGHGAGQGPASRRWLMDLSALRDAAERALDLALDWTSPPEGQVLSAQLEGSDDAQHWQALRRAQLLDLPAAASAPALQLRHIDWPAGQALPRYLRLQFDAPVLLRSGALTVESRQRPDLATELLSWQAEPRGVDEAPRWRLDLPVALRPEALRVQLPALNQLLSLRLEQRQQDGQAWQGVHRFVAWRMQRGGVEAQSPAEPLQAAPARQWRLVAEGPVPAGLEQAPLDLQWLWRPPQLVSLLPADPALLAGLRLQLSASTQEPGRLALRTLMPGYQPGSEYQLPEALPGPVQAQAAHPAPPAWEDPATRKRWGLWAVLGFSVAGLAGLAWRLKGEVTSTEPPQT
ncbi:DUF3999 family protein [Roseateles sp. DB2]|uniref:DUF3999 family protein n=1 Tax=Roseateles sp. DB2 TaxID=3453717 RepID=UPI003EED48C4